MARVTYNADEADQNFQIEDGIRGTLKDHAVATTDPKYIEDCYELLDDDMNPMAGDLNAKCKAICKAIDATYELKGDEAQFKNA